MLHEDTAMHLLSSCCFNKERDFQQESGDHDAQATTDLIIPKCSSTKGQHYSRWRGHSLLPEGGKGANRERNATEREEDLDGNSNG